MSTFTTAVSSFEQVIYTACAQLGVPHDLTPVIRSIVDDKGRNECSNCSVVCPLLNARKCNDTVLVKYILRVHHMNPIIDNEQRTSRYAKNYMKEVSRKWHKRVC